MRIADSVLFTCWPPAPLARNTSTRRSAGFSSISMSSSISGDTNTAANDVCRRWPESNGDLRTSRCTPVSVRSQPNAYSPRTWIVALLMPATSPADSLEHVDRVAVLLGPSQVHPEQHLGPVLRLGAARAGLDVEERVVRVHLAGEHPAELERLDLPRDALDLTDHVARACSRRASSRASSCSSAASSSDLSTRPSVADDGFELGALATEVLRALGIGPDLRVLELAVDFLEALALRVIVKDTSAERRVRSFRARMAGAI